MADVVPINEYSITINGEPFNLLQVPGEETKLVKSKKEDVLRNISLDKLISGLNRSGGLLFLAFNGVAGFGGLRAAINKLEDDLALLCRDTNLTMNRFKEKTGDILGNITKTFTFLTKGNEKIGLNFLAQCATTATGMAAEAEGLARRFDELATRTTAISGDTQIQESKTADERRQLEEDLKKLTAEKEKATALSESMKKLKEKMEGLYKEAKEKAEQASDRAFGLQIANAIMGPPAKGIGAFAGAFASVKAGIPPSLPPAETTSPEKTAAESKVTEAKKEAEKAKTEADTAKKALETANSAKTKADGELLDKEATVIAAKRNLTTTEGELDKKKDDAELKTKVTNAKAAVTEAETKRDAAKKPVDEAVAAVAKAKTESERKDEMLKAALAGVTAAAQALEAIATQLGSAAKDYMDIAADYNKQKGSYLDKLLEYQEKEAQQLADLAKYAVEMSSVKDLAAVKKTASLSLIQAVKALNEVSQILREAAGFWNSMADACKNLASGGLQSTLKAYTAAEPDPVERKKLYQEEDFKKEIIEYTASWKALQLICHDYAKQAEATRGEISANIVRSPSEEESLQLTEGLAKKFLLDAKEAELKAEQAIKDTKAAAA